MDAIKKIKKINLKKIPKQQKKYEFRLKINLWKAFLGIIILLFFLPFIMSLFQFRTSEGSVDTSQALSDIKDDKVKEVLIQNNKMILTYKDGLVKTATK